MWVSRCLPIETYENFLFMNDHFNKLRLDLQVLFDDVQFDYIANEWDWE